ncbi:nucleotide exchange factor GrpE [Salinifilum aidingensis]
MTDKPEMARNDEEQEPVVVRDKRRFDPDTGERRAPDGAGEEPQVAESISGTLEGDLPAEPASDASEAADGEQGDLRKQVDDLTADIQRVTAEYANYRKRVERDREAVIQSAKAGVAEDLLTVLDDIERADAHGDLTGAFKAVADKLVDSLRSAGLEDFGTEGEEFDPNMHEAVQHATSSEVSGPTVSTVLRRGYRFGERVLRPAMVAVTDYEPGSDEQAEPAEETAGGESAQQD